MQLDVTTEIWNHYPPFSLRIGLDEIQHLLFPVPLHRGAHVGDLTQDLLDTRRSQGRDDTILGYRVFRISISGMKNAPSLIRCTLGQTTWMPLTPA